MTKVYNTHDSHEIHFDSGKSIILTNQEWDELIDGSDIVEELQDDLIEANTTIDTQASCIVDIEKKVKEWEDKDIKRPSKKALVNDFTEDIQYILDELD